MSKNTAQVAFNALTLAYPVTGETTNTVFVIGRTLRGPDNDPKDLITSVPQFVSIFGDEDPNHDFPTQCMKAIRAGASLRVCRVVGSSADVSSTAVIATSGAVGLFKFESKEKGDYTNDIEVTVKAASSGSANYFDLEVEDTTTGEKETYQNLIVSQYGSAAPYNYLKQVTDYSRMVKPVYSDISGISSQPRPANNTYTMTGGADDPAELADFTGVQGSKTGFYAFDDYTDSYIIAAPGEDETSLDGLASVGGAYANGRQDLVYFQHLDNDHTTVATITTEMGTLGVTHSYMGVIGGGAYYTDTTNGGVVAKHNLGEVLGVIAKSHATYGYWVSPTNQLRGKLPTPVGVVNNFGSPNRLSELNQLANLGVNMVINRNGVNMLWDFYSMGSDSTPEEFLTVVFTKIYLKRTLVPYLESFLGEPNVPFTWNSMYHGAKKFLDGLLGKAFNSYSWDGDQFAPNVNTLSYNSSVDVLQGKYKIQLTASLVVPMVEITMNFIIDNTSVQTS